MLFFFFPNQKGFWFFFAITAVSLLLDAAEAIRSGGNSESFNYLTAALILFGLLSIVLHKANALFGFANGKKEKQPIKSKIKLIVLVALFVWIILLTWLFVFDLTFWIMALVKFFLAG